MTNEYKTVSSMLLTLRWRTSNENLSNTLIIFAIWPATRREIIFSITLEPEIFASTSAAGELQQAPSSLTLPALLSNVPNKLGFSTRGGVCAEHCCMSAIGLGLGQLGLGLKLFLLFLDSKDSRTWCISLMNSITPPIIDAWSPYKIKKKKKQIRLEIGLIKTLDVCVCVFVPFWYRNMGSKNVELWGVHSSVFFGFSPRLCETYWLVIWYLFVLIN